MQASTAPNEQRLPRQILRRSAAVQAHLDAKAELKKVPANPDTPPAVPSVPVATASDPNPGPTPSEPPVDPRHLDPLYWKQRFQVVEGRLRTRETEHRTEVENYLTQLTELTEQIRTLKANVPAAPADVGEFLTPEQVELLGADEAQTIVDTVLKGARAEVAKLVDAEIKPLRQAVTKRKADTAEDLKRAFLAKLEELVPNYVEIDETDEWKLWLDGVDEDSEETRQEVLNGHMGMANAKAVASMFKRYQRTLTKPPAPPVAPNGSGATGAPAPAPQTRATAMPTAAEIKDFYKRKATLRKGQPGYITEQDAIAFEKRLKPQKPGQ